MSKALTIGFLLPVTILEFSKTKKEVKVRGFRRGSKFIRPFRRKQKVNLKASKDKKIKAAKIAGIGTLILAGGGTGLLLLKGKGKLKLSTKSQNPIKNIVPQTVSYPTTNPLNKTTKVVTEKVENIVEKTIEVKYPDRIDPPDSVKKSIEENADFLAYYPIASTSTHKTLTGETFELTLPEKAALDSYVGTGYKNINSVARGDIADLAPDEILEAEAKADLIQNALLHKLPETKLPSTDHYFDRITKLPDSQIEEFKQNIGGVYRDKAFMSTTITTRSPKNSLIGPFEPNNTGVYMRIRPDSRGQGESLGKYIGSPTDIGLSMEDEVLFPKGSSFIVEKVVEAKDKVGNQVYIFDLREIHPKFNKK